MFEQLIQFNNIGLFVLRLAVAAVFIYHSLPKLKNAGKMAEGMGWPVGAVIALGLVELVSAAGFIIGFYTQFAALLLALIMIGAIYLKIAKWSVPFSAMDKMGWEFDLILFAANVAIFFGGPGPITVWSLGIL